MTQANGDLNDTQTLGGEEKFELSPEEATGMGKPRGPATLNRKKILMVLCISFSVIICGGLIINTLVSSKKKKAASASEQVQSVNSSSNEFLNSLRNRSFSRRESEPEPEKPEIPEAGGENLPPEPALPPVSFNKRPDNDAPQPPPQQTAAPPPQPPPSAPVQNAPDPTYFKSSLVPQIQGRLFSQNPQMQAQAYQTQGGNLNNAPSSAAAVNYSGQMQDYALQNNQSNKQEFNNSSNNAGVVYDGHHLGGNALWTGTVIPGVLETAINTDLPGSVLARVTQNVYDSQTGRSLLIPQGTLLVARYNSSVSYAQRRVQIVWDTLIRPDGFQINLQGAEGVDRSGMSGQAARYSENWFEYLKAAGIITLFSVANSKMTETAARYAQDESTASGIASSNAGFVNQIGGNIVSRALNIQPTLTVDNGTPVNIMLNKTVYFPPVKNIQINQKYILE